VVVVVRVPFFSPYRRHPRLLDARPRSLANAFASRCATMSLGILPDAALDERAPSPSSSSRAWRRSALGYKEKFVDAFTFERVTVRQFSSRAAFSKAMHRECSPQTCDGDFDAVPETAFTVWDASILLGKYASRADVWARLSQRAIAEERACIALELGAGTGLASLILASSDACAKRGGVFALTDLPDVVEFTKRNARENKSENGGRVPDACVLAAAPMRWGRIDDVDALPPALRWPDVVLGADLMYTSNTDILRNLAESTTALMKPGSVGVFAACKEHRPEAIEKFVECMAPSFDVQRVPASTVHSEYPANDSDFEILEFWRLSD